MSFLPAGGCGKAPCGRPSPSFAAHPAVFIHPRKSVLCLKIAMFSSFRGAWEAALYRLQLFLQGCMLKRTCAEYECRPAHTRDVLPPTRAVWFVLCVGARQPPRPCARCGASDGAPGSSAPLPHRSAAACVESIPRAREPVDSPGCRQSCFEGPCFVAAVSVSGVMRFGLVLWVMRSGFLPVAARSPKQRPIFFRGMSDQF